MVVWDELDATKSMVLDLQNRQDEEGPKSFWSENKNDEKSAQSSHHHDNTDMKMKSHPRDRIGKKT